MSVNICFFISHAAFEPSRHEPFLVMHERLRNQIDKEDGIIVTQDHEKRGATAVFLEGLAQSVNVAGDMTHVCYLPDDAIIPTGFVTALKGAISAKPEQIICCFPNHVLAKSLHEAGNHWYITDDGAVMFAGVLPVSMAKDFLLWRKENLLSEDIAKDDESVNLYAMATGKKIYKTLPALVDHRDDLTSLEGNDGHEFRKAAVPPPEDCSSLRFDGPAPYVGKTYAGNFWGLCSKLKKPLLETCFMLARGEPVFYEATCVYIATPAYGGMVHADFADARHVTCKVFEAAGGKVILDTNKRDSLVHRGRHACMSSFLISPATHLLWWDADLVPTSQDFIVNMVKADKDVVGCACPRKDNTNGVVARMLMSDYEKRCVECDGLTVEVAEIGTGIMMIKRQVIIDMINLHHERTFYMSDELDRRGEPRWALFEPGIVDRRYLSEDYGFCNMWREMGGKIYAMAKEEFAHWGTFPFTGNLLKAWRLVEGLPGEQEVEKSP